jgi:hypothetical protein
MPVQTMGNGLIEAHDLSDDDDGMDEDDDGADGDDGDGAHAPMAMARDDSEAGRTQRALRHAEAKSKAKATSSRQRALYGAEGQYNPNDARAAKKRARREAKAVAEAAEDDSGSDFDWES